MIVDINDPRVSRAIKIVKETHQPKTQREFENLFEKQYHCKIVPDYNAPWCNTGKLHISEEKYYNWFILQFGGGDE